MAGARRWRFLYVFIKFSVSRCHPKSLVGRFTQSYPPPFYKPSCQNASTASGPAASRGKFWAPQSQREPKAWASRIELFLREKADEMRNQKLFHGKTCIRIFRIGILILTSHQKKRHPSPLKPVVSFLQLDKLLKASVVNKVIYNGQRIWLDITGRECTGWRWKFKQIPKTSRNLILKKKRNHKQNLVSKSSI